VRRFDDRGQWLEAADKGMATPFIRDLPQQFETQLGKWFKDGRNFPAASGRGSRLSRAFMRSEADILVLDEPTAAMDAGAEAQVFEHFQSLTRERIAILISHRFSTVRMADQIAVLDQGRIAELGSHDELVKQDGVYARLFQLQARATASKPVPVLDNWGIGVLCSRKSPVIQHRHRFASRGFVEPAVAVVEADAAGDRASEDCHHEMDLVAQPPGD